MLHKVLNMRTNIHLNLHSVKKQLKRDKSKYFFSANLGSFQLHASISFYCLRILVHKCNGMVTYQLNIRYLCIRV